MFFSRIKGAGNVDAALRVTVAKRVPLAEVPLNRPNATGNGHGAIAASDAIHCSSSARTIAAPSVGAAAKENLCQSNFETPRKEPEGSSKPEPLDYFSGSGLLDDDFDESIFEQIDILCEQKSAEKAAVTGLDHSCHERVSSESSAFGGVNLSWGTSAVSEGIGNGDLLSSSGADLDPKEEEHVDMARQSLQSGTMPEEYSKYLQSLNERQREAACTDMSTPLMIVAGPGSGKVFSNSTSLLGPMQFNIFFSFEYLPFVLY